MNAKEQFIANKNLSSWWGPISSDPRFDAVLLHVSGMAFEGQASAEQREGALKFRESLLTIAISDAPPVQFTKTGINHNLDEPRRLATDEGSKGKKDADKKPTQKK